jgi:hypothetical protein
MSGRWAPGAAVRAITLAEGDSVVAMEAVQPSALILSISELGFGKRTPLENYRLTARGGKGVINMKVTKRTGQVVDALPVAEDTDVMIITAEGKIIRIEGNEIRKVGRGASGVRVVRMSEQDRVAAACVVPDAENDVEGPDSNQPRCLASTVDARRSVTILSMGTLVALGTAGPKLDPVLLQEKQDRLFSVLGEMEQVLVAYSGGTDSAYLAWAASSVLGGNAIAITADSPSIPESHKLDAAEYARICGFRHEFIPTFEFENPDYVKNDPDRCFHCKDELFNRLER